MNPETHLLVVFLRFLNFNDAANQVIHALLNNGVINIHPDILKATDLFNKRSNVSNSIFNSQPNRNIIFQRIAEQFDLFNLPNGGLILEQPIQHTL